jgi:cytoskeletal protein RodZ
MTGPRKRTPRKQELDAGLRRLDSGGIDPSGNGFDPTSNGAGPSGNGAARGASGGPTGQRIVDPGIAVGERRAPMATPRKLGEILLMARQSKGIELERAARDTKIRGRYLSALESGEFRELPGAVYTKGFLRNYAQYLGLDPDVVVAHYKRELGGRPTERVAVVMKTLRAPRAGLTVTPGLLVAGVLTVLVIAFVGYIGVQFVRFVQPPVLTITRPATVDSTIDAETTVLAGTASAGATVTITGPDGPLTVTATSTGAWTADVPLRKGRNEFLIVALDPQTTKRSPESRVIVMVPLPKGPEAPVMSLSSPADGTTFTNGAIPIVGTTDGASISVAASYLGPPTAVPSGATAPSPPAAPEAKDITVETDGTFSGSYELTTGQWRLTISATGDANRQTSLTRQITVAYTGINALIEIKGGRVWLRVRVDGELSKKTPTLGGIVFEDGAKLAITAKELIEIRSGVPSRTFLTVNGVSYGALTGGTVNDVWAVGPAGAPTVE